MKSIFYLQKNIRKTNASTSLESEMHTYNYGHVKVVYAVNDEGQVVSKTSYRLNAKTGEWIPNFIYQATYTGDNSTLNYSRWNKFSQRQQVTAGERRNAEDDDEPSRKKISLKTQSCF